MSSKPVKIAVALIVCAGVWIVGRSAASGPPAAVPEIGAAFSLDLRVVADAEHDTVYAVEQRARPHYRIFAFEPSDGSVETIYTVPEDAIIYGIALSPDRRSLAVGYSPDFGLDGNGIWTLDLATREMTERTAVISGVYLTDITWSLDGTSVLATEVDRRGEDETLAAVRVEPETGVLTVIEQRAINPVELTTGVYVLELDEDNARRSIGAIDDDGTRHTIEVGDTNGDLDHLIAHPAGTSLDVAMIERTESSFSVGEPAGAHGNHGLPSDWWTIDLEPAASTSRGIEPIVVYDAARSSDAIVYATTEGLSIGVGERIDLITSRAIRFVAA